MKKQRMGCAFVAVLAMALSACGRKEQASTTGDLSAAPAPASVAASDTGSAASSPTGPVANSSSDGSPGLGFPAALPSQPDPLALRVDDTLKAIRLAEGQFKAENKAYQAAYDQWIQRNQEAMRRVDALMQQISVAASAAQAEDVKRLEAELAAARTAQAEKPPERPATVAPVAFKTWQSAWRRCVALGQKEDATRMLEELQSSPVPLSADQWHAVKVDLEIFQQRGGEPFLAGLPPEQQSR